MKELPSLRSPASISDLRNLFVMWLLKLQEFVIRVFFAPFLAALSISALIVKVLRFIKATHDLPAVLILMLIHLSAAPQMCSASSREAIPQIYWNHLHEFGNSISTMYVTINAALFFLSSFYTFAL